MGRKKAIRELRGYAADLLGADAPAATPALRVRFRPAAVLASAFLVVFGNITAVAASNSAVPGDVLYPLDRAYESVASLVGIDLATTEERIAESSVLLARGEFAQALELLGEALPDDDTAVGPDLELVTADLASMDQRSLDRQQLHTTISGLAAAMRAPDLPQIEWQASVAAHVELVAAAALPVPPGQDEGFVPPGQDEEFVPPGQDEEFVPPGQDEEFVPPGQRRNNREVGR